MATVNPSALERATGGLRVTGEISPKRTLLSQNEIISAIAGGTIALLKANENLGWFGKAKRDKLVEENIQRWLKDTYFLSNDIPRHKLPVLSNIDKLTPEEFMKLGAALVARKQKYEKILRDKTYSNQRNKRQVEKWLATANVFLEGWQEIKAELDQKLAQSQKLQESQTQPGGNTIAQAGMLSKLDNPWVIGGALVAVSAAAFASKKGQSKKGSKTTTKSQNRSVNAQGKKAVLKV